MHRVAFLAEVAREDAGDLGFQRETRLKAMVATEEMAAQEAMEGAVAQGPAVLALAFGPSRVPA